MGKIILDRSGELRKGVFYRFDVPFDDGTDGLNPAPDWIVVPRTPTWDQLERSGQETWIWISGLGDVKDRVVTNDCAADMKHVTRWFYRRVVGEAFGGKRVSPIIATESGVDWVALSDELRRRVEALRLRGARIDEIDLKIHGTGKRAKGHWALQFIGTASLRLPKIVGAPNRCPYCGQGTIFCETCGHYPGSCEFCKKPMMIIDEKHGGPNDKRIPFEANLWNVIEGKTWDGSDLVQAHGDKFASKRFIDCLLAIHAAPFYAEPVWFCVDGMNDQQKRWLDDLQKPLEG